MKCDACKEDFNGWTELFWNGLWLYREHAVRSIEGGQSAKSRVRKAMVCDPCLHRPTEYQPGEVDQGRWIT